MGREITGAHVEHKSPYAKVMPKVSADTDREVNPKSPAGNSKVKDFEVKECTTEVPWAGNSCEKQDVLATKSTNYEAEKPDMKSAKTDDQNSGTPVKTLPAMAAVGNTSVKNTPQKLSDVSIEKQVYESPRAVETPVSPAASNTKSPSSSKISQPSTPSIARKNLDDEDNWSMASSYPFYSLTYYSTAASARTTRSRTTVGVAPSFSIEERLQKRKEYYAKLEEKRKALEAEKQEYEARTKEEEEAAIKQLRRSMVFRANPVPNFYYEKPPPKKELKKLPTTRAVSPKFGRRKSCSDAVSCCPEEKICGRASRHSLGSNRDLSTPTSTPKKKDRLVGSSSVSKFRDRPRPVKDQPSVKTSSKISNQPNSDIAVQS
ncbi:hypothetical protein Cgig2_001710 [Carnegiea gigantea]|uniref:TPX2 C-terminal domain-containing protein n=1 Tax=Carnegiea gigantea TaxID=171969 RepID=A0A9Q1JH81_9CARY|nr:hypothetical protein Cgig2_001710 [Carnegiea gigantea]